MNEEEPKSLRILIADDEPLILMDLRKMLESLNYEVVGEGCTGEQAVEMARALKPDLVVLDIKMREIEDDGIQAAEIITEENISPVIFLTAYSDQPLVSRARSVGVYGYLVKPFREADLGPAIEIALGRWEERQALNAQARDLEDKLETRKAVDRAKGILMDRYSLKEQEAFRRIQLQSMNSRKSMREIAEAIIIALEV